MKINYVGNTLKSIRAKQNKTKYMVATAVDITYSAYNHFENGTRLPNLCMLVKLSKQLETNLNHLILLTCIDMIDRHQLTINELYEAYNQNIILSKEEQFIITTYAFASPDNKETILALCKSINELSQPFN